MGEAVSFPSVNHVLWRPRVPLQQGSGSKRAPVAAAISIAKGAMTTTWENADTLDDEVGLEGARGGWGLGPQASGCCNTRLKICIVFKPLTLPCVPPGSPTVMLAMRSTRRSWIWVRRCVISEPGIKAMPRMYGSFLAADCLQMQM